MEDRTDLVFAEGAFQQNLIANITEVTTRTRSTRPTGNFTLRNPFADKAHYVGACLSKPTHKPAADETGSTCNERWTIEPKAIHCVSSRKCLPCQGACPLSHSASSRRFSRNVSIGCQKPSCR